MQIKSHDWRRLARLARHAVHDNYGRRVCDGHVHMTLAGDCRQPYGFSMWSRGSIDIMYTGDRIKPLLVSGEARCKKCEECLEARKKEWTARAQHELSQSRVSAFGTLTMSIEQHLEMDFRVRRKLRLEEPCRDFETLSQIERFHERALMFGAEVTKWLGRIRRLHGRGNTAAFRYLLIAEPHDGPDTSTEMRGRPHFHVLLHDSSGKLFQGSPPRFEVIEGVRVWEIPQPCDDWVIKKVRSKKNGKWYAHAFLRDTASVRLKWRMGFSKFQFCEDLGSAYYVCDYLTKEGMWYRPRASNTYGHLHENGRVPPEGGDRLVKLDKKFDLRPAGEAGVDPPPHAGRPQSRSETESSSKGGSGGKPPHARGALGGAQLAPTTSERSEDD